MQLSPRPRRTRRRLGPSGGQKEPSAGHRKDLSSSALATTLGFLNYLTLGLHYPKPNHLNDVLEKAAEVSAVAMQQNGVVDAGAWLDEANQRVVMMSLWVSEAAAFAARPALRPLVMDAPWSEWETLSADNLLQLVRRV